MQIQEGKPASAAGPTPEIAETAEEAEHRKKLEADVLKGLNPSGAQDASVDFTWADILVVVDPQRDFVKGECDEENNRIMARCLLPCLLYVTPPALECSECNVPAADRVADSM